MEKLTKYVLHGGRSKIDSTGNRAFWIELVKNLSEPIKILVMAQARDESLWVEKYEQTAQFFKLVCPKVKFVFELGDQRLKVLAKQIERADVIFMLGGETKRLKKFLVQIEGLEKLWSGKVVAGSSAGALVLAKYWYENDDDTYNEGLGILNLKLFCHYSADKMEKLEKLKHFGQDWEVKTLAEGEFVVVEK